MNEEAIVLLSGGQDSTTCLGWAKTKFACIALSIMYGQKHVAELSAAERIAERMGVQRLVEHIPTLANIGGSALVGDGELAADGGYGDKEAPSGLPTSFVPGRNVLFLTIAAAVAVKRGIRHIVTGVCQTDYSGYPDCREEFVRAMVHTLNLAMPSDAGPIQIHTPLMHLSKAQTVQMARNLGDETWDALGMSLTCYNGITGGCGACPACTLRAKGFAEAGFADPARG